MRPSDLRQFDGSHHALHAWRGRLADKQTRRNPGECGIGRRQIFSQDAYVIDGMTGSCLHRQCQPQTDCDHRERLLTCWYISSAALTTLELAS